MSHIFISFHHRSLAFARELRVKIHDQLGLDCWDYETNLRTSSYWRREIDNGINDCLALIVVMTQEAKASEYVTYEWAYALGKNKPVFPLLLETIELHPRLDEIQYIDFRSVDKPWERLFEDIQRIALATAPVVATTVPDIITNILTALNQPSQKKRAQALAQLEKLDDPRMPDVLAHLLNHPASDVRLGAALQLANRFSDQRALTPLIVNLEGTQTDRASDIDVINALSKVGDSDAIRSLIPFAVDKSLVGKAAQDAIVALIDDDEISGGEIALELLHYLDTIPKTHIGHITTIIEFLGNLWILGDHQVAILNRLYQYLDKRQDVAVRQATLHTLEVIGLELSINPFLGILSDPTDDIEFREAVALALGRLRNNAPVEQLVELAHKEKNINFRYILIRSLAITRHPTLESGFERLLQSKNTDLVALGIWGLMRLKSERAVKPIARFLDSTHKTTTLAIDSQGWVQPFDDDAFWLTEDSKLLCTFAEYALKHINTADAQEAIAQKERK